MFHIFILAVLCMSLVNSKGFIPTRVPESYPRTSFTCLDRPLNAFYGDAETSCQMFHICLLSSQGFIDDIRMLCPEGSLFDQETGSCRKSHQVDCLRNYELTEKVAWRLMQIWNKKKVKRQVSNPTPELQPISASVQKLENNGGVKLRFTEPPRYNSHQLPVTSFSCRGKVIGGYYADPETQCQMFHVCLYVAETDHVMDTKFLCLNETVFDQQHFVCNDWWKVDCDKAENHYDKNFELFVGNAHL